MACHGRRKFVGGETACELPMNHEWFHFDGVAYWEDDTTIKDTEWQQRGGFRYEPDGRGGWKHIGL